MRNAETSRSAPACDKARSRRKIAARKEFSHPVAKAKAQKRVLSGRRRRGCDRKATPGRISQRNQPGAARLYGGGRGLVVPNGSRGVRGLSFEMSGMNPSSTMRTAPAARRISRPFRRAARPAGSDPR